MLLAHISKLFSSGLVMYISLSITSLIRNQSPDTEPGPWALDMIFSIITREKVCESSVLGSTLEQTGLVRSSPISVVSILLSVSISARYATQGHRVLGCCCCCFLCEGSQRILGFVVRVEGP